MEFIDLAAQQKRIKPQLDERMAAVLSHGRYILGPEVDVLEAALAEFAQSRFAVSCANGTDALTLPLLAWDIGAGDAVFCPSFSYCATAEAIALVGATPVFVDISPSTFNICPESLSAAIDMVKSKGELIPRAVIAVDLFGQCADYPALMPIIKAHGLKLIADNAQGFGSTLDGKHPTHWADATTTSFFPAKPLGCYGDGGALMTNDAAVNEAVLSLRFHGRDSVPYNHKQIGINSRLDTLQAAVLLCKLDIFDDEIAARNRIAARYTEHLSDVVTTPYIAPNVVSTWAQYTIKTANPNALQSALSEQGIPSARYYPLPIHQQTAYDNYPVAGNGLPVTEACAKVAISLPMHPYLTVADQDRIIKAIRGTVDKAP